MALTEATNLNEAVNLLVPDSNIIHNIINEDALTEITIENGTIPSIRKVLADNMQWKSTIEDWTNGTFATDPLQLYLFNGVWYWAPSATMGTTIALGATPVGDNNWKIAPVMNNQTYTFDTIENMQLGKTINGLDITDYLYEGMSIKLTDEVRHGDFTARLAADYTAEIADDVFMGIYVPITGTDYVAVRSDGWAMFTDADWFIDDINADNGARMNYANSKRGLIRYSARVYLSSIPILQYRGSTIMGAASVDTASGRGTKFKKYGEVKAPLFQTELAGGHGGGVATHYYNLHNILFDGDLENQSEEHDLVQFWGAWVTSSIDNVFICNSLGQGITFSGGSDLRIGTLWVQGITCTTGYAVNTNESASAGDREGLLYAQQLYIENISNNIGGDPRNEETERGNAINLNRFVTVNIDELHIEGARRTVDISSNQLVNITKLSYAYVGLSTDTDGSAVRYVDAGTKVLHVGSLTGATGINLVNFVGLADGVTSTSIPELPIGDDVRTGAYSATNITTNYTRSEPTIYANKVGVMQVGGASSSNFRFYDSSVDKYSYVKNSGVDLEFGSTKNQAGEVKFFSLRSYGNAADKIEFYEPIKVAENSSASNINIGSLYRTPASFARGAGLIYQTEDGVTEGMGMVSTSTASGLAPTSSAKYIGQEHLNTTTKVLYKAFSVGNGSGDWVAIN
jgi:hypothetical protein